MSRRAFKILTLLAVLLVVAAVAAPRARADEITNSKKKQRAIQMQIKDQEQKLKRTKEAEVSTINDLDSIDRQLYETKQDLKKYRSRLQETEKNMKAVSADIEALNKKIERHKQWMARKVQSMYKNGKYGDLILVLAASQNASDLLKRVRYLEILAKHERERIEDHKNDLAALDERERHLERLQRQLTSEEDNVKFAEEKLAQEKERKQQVLTTIKKKREAYEQMLNELKEASVKLQKMIEEAEKKQKFTSTGFMKMKGKLPWPVEGRVALRYGSQTDPTFKTPVFRNGIYIQTKPNAIAKSVSAGRVEYANWFKGYGQLVIVNHGGGYHSLYANLSEIFLKEGDIIGYGVDIGKVGDSSVLDKPSLYFEIRYKGKPLDPQQWLQK